MEAKASFASDPGVPSSQIKNSFAERFAALKEQRSKSEENTSVAKYDHGTSMTIVKYDPNGQVISKETVAKVPKDMREHELYKLNQINNNGT